MNAKEYLDQYKHINANIELLEATGNDTQELIQQKEKIVKQISEITDVRFVRVLYLRYIQCVTMNAIAQVLGYNIRHVHRIHKEALKEFERVHLGGVTMLDGEFIMTAEEFLKNLEEGPICT